MFDSSNVIVGLETGTSKICAVVGEVNAEGAFNIVGVGQAKSRGVRKGEIVDHVKAEEDIRAAIANAEQMADVEIRSVFLGVTGAHIRSFNNRGVYPVVSADREITEDDVRDVIKNARAINLPTDHDVIHTARQHFHVDGQPGVANPVGMLGARLEVDMHVVHGHRNRLQNAIRLVKGLQLDVDGIVFNGRASAMAVLKSEQREMGAVVIDLGAGITEYVVYANGILRHSGVLAVGGDHVSNDIGIGLKIPLGQAEQLKIEHGTVAHDAEARTFTPTGEGIFPSKDINLGHMHSIMAARLEETFQLIEEDISRTGLSDHLRAGVFLSGGGSRVPGLTVMAENIFQMPVYVAGADALNGATNVSQKPEFNTAIGIVKYGASQQQPRAASDSLFGRLQKGFGKLIGRA